MSTKGPTETNREILFEGRLYDFEIAGLKRKRVYRLDDSGNLNVEADVDADGRIDTFAIAIDKGDFRFERIGNGSFKLFLPEGKDAVQEIQVGSVNGDRLSDIALKLRQKRTVLLINSSPEPARARHTIDEYKGHLMAVHELVAAGRFTEAMKKSVEYNYGLNHNWVVPHNSDTVLPWIDNDPQYTDCVLDIERVIAEINNPDGTLEGFETTQRRLQFYDFNGPERNDFFEAEWIPHNGRFFTNITADINRGLWSFENAKINKDSWWRAENPGKTPPKDYCSDEWHKKTAGIKSADDPCVNEVGVMYTPFPLIIIVDPETKKIVLWPEFLKKLPTYTVFAVVNNDRYFATHKTDIPVSHTGFIVVEDGEARIINSTPTNDAGVPSVSEETIDSFFRHRFVDGVVAEALPDGSTAYHIKYTSGDPAVGLILLAPVMPGNGLK